jgi:CheY-like chemotaxis protein
MSKRILVVEDQPDNRQIIRDMLAASDYQITEAENGQEALAAMRSAVKDRRREWPAAMTMYRNLTARANCWRKFGSTCPNRSRSIAPYTVPQMDHARLGRWISVTVSGVEHETEHTGLLGRAVPRKRRVPARTKFPTTPPCAPP